MQKDSKKDSLAECLLPSKAAALHRQGEGMIRQQAISQGSEKLGRLVPQESKLHASIQAVVRPLRLGTTPSAEQAQGRGGVLEEEGQAASLGHSRNAAQGISDPSSRAALEGIARVEGNAAQIRDDFISRLAGKRLRDLLGDDAAQSVLPMHICSPPEEPGKDAAGHHFPQTEGKLPPCAEPSICACKMPNLAEHSHSHR